MPGVSLQDGIVWKGTLSSSQNPKEVQNPGEYRFNYVKNTQDIISI